MLLSAASVLTAQNAVSASRAGHSESSIDPDQLKPSECSGISLNNKVGGSGLVNGTAANDLVVAGSGDDTVDGSGGDDCILGGAGADELIGSGGTDVCIGGAGSDTFDPSCESTYQ